MVTRGQEGQIGCDDSRGSYRNDRDIIDDTKTDGTRGEWTESLLMKKAATFFFSPHNATKSDQVLFRP
jgi:hypothetical protein